MSREQLLLELDGHDRVFHPGDPITGRVRVGTTTPSVGRALAVAVWWETTGQGDVDRGAEQVIELAASGAAIDDRTFPFSFPAAAGPLSYTGRTFSLEWRVEARLGAANRGSASNWQGIVLEADPRAPVHTIGAAQLFWLTDRNFAAPVDNAEVVSRDRVSRLLEDQEAFDRRAQPTQIGCLTFFIVSCALGFLTIPLSMIAELLGVEDVFSRYGQTTVLVLTSLVIVALLALLAFERRVERNLGLTLRLADRIVRPGDDLVCVIGLHPVRAATIAGAEVRVTSEESSTSYGDSGSTARVELFTSTVVASPSRTFNADAPEQLTVRIPLPRDAAATFESRAHGVKWQAQVSVKLGPRTSIERKLGFVVYPNGSTYWRKARPEAPVTPQHAVRSCFSGDNHEHGAGD
jgi:hypothetical protein